MLKPFALAVPIVVIILSARAMTDGELINPCGMAVDDIEKALDMHNDLKWIDRAIETHECRVVEDDDATWSIFHFGTKCPLELKAGILSCKSFSEKQKGCKSYVCESFARNYLAHHGFDSTNHSVYQHRANAFDEAAAVGIVLGEYTMDERIQYREHIQNTEADAANQRDDEQLTRTKRHRSMKPRSPSMPPPASRSRSSTDVSRQVIIGRGSGTSSGSRQEVVPHGSASGTSGTATVSTADLMALEGCLDRAAGSQKRLCDTMTFFARQCEDERKIILEAKTHIAELVLRSRFT